MVRADSHGHVNGHRHAHTSLGLVLVELAVVDGAVNELELDVLALLFPQNQKLVVQYIGTQRCYDLCSIVVGYLG